MTELIAEAKAHAAALREIVANYDSISEAADFLEGLEVGAILGNEVAGSDPVAWTNLHHLRRYLDGSSEGLNVTRKQAPAWNMGLYLSPRDLQFVPVDLLPKGAK